MLKFDDYSYSQTRPDSSACYDVLLVPLETGSCLVPLDDVEKQYLPQWSRHSVARQKTSARGIGWRFLSLLRLLEFVRWSRHLVIDFGLLGNRMYWSCQRFAGKGLVVVREGKDFCTRRNTGGTSPHAPQSLAAREPTRRRKKKHSNRGAGSTSSPHPFVAGGDLQSKPQTQQAFYCEGEGRSVVDGAATADGEHGEVTSGLRRGGPVHADDGWWAVIELAGGGGWLLWRPSLLKPKEKKRESFGGRSWETMAAVEGAGTPIVRLALGHKAGEEGEEGLFGRFFVRKKESEMAGSVGMERLEEMGEGAAGCV
ncbi:hypothetical protein NC652_040523 [Populus alba x Populus x berolinensis]|nr:hypothetical protein NC652_040523 [Populus alba x Populus x berolinensis]